MTGYCYFSPGVGTVPTPNPLGMPAGPTVFSGEPRSLVVACDLGRAIIGVVSGVEVWRRSYPGSWPRALDIFKGIAFVGAGTSIELLDPKTGYLHKTMQVPNAPAPVNGLHITSYNNQVYVTCAFSLQGVGSVRSYTITDLELTQTFSNPFVASHPRHAVLVAGWVFVADTFGHEVYGVTLGGAKRDFRQVYFPNHLQALSSDRILITAEHENRVLLWDYYPAPGSAEIVMAAPVAPFNDASKTKDDIVAAEIGTVDLNSTFNPKKSMCATEYSGELTLYSPNSARRYGTDTLISDTDNHRVIVTRNGGIVTKLTNFNNPVNSVMIE